MNGMLSSMEQIRSAPVAGGLWRAAPYGLALLLGLLLARLPLPLAAGALAATAVFLLLIIQPLVGLGLALLLGPLAAAEGNLPGLGALLGGPLNSGQLLLLLTLGAWVARGLLRRRLNIPHTFFNAPLLLFMLVTAVTLLGARSIPDGLKELVKWLEMGLIVLLIADLAGHAPRRALPWLAGALLLAGFSQALLGIWQFGLRDTGPAHFAVLGRFYRAYGTFEQPNPFGGYMNLSALLALGWLAGMATAWLRARRLPWDSPLWLAVGALAAAALATSLALYFSWSRGAWLGFAAGSAVLFFFWPRRRGAGVALLLLMGALLLAGLTLDLIPAAAQARLGDFTDDLRFGDVRGVPINDANYAVLERLAHWQAAFGMAQDNLWLGVGFGNYEAAYPDYALINWPAALGHAHNYYINLLAEVGVLGLLAYLVLWTAVFWQTLRVIDRLDGAEHGLALGLLACWAALTVHHLVDKLYVNNIYIHLGVMLGVLELLIRRAPSGITLSAKI